MPAGKTPKATTQHLLDGAIKRADTLHRIIEALFAHHSLPPSEDMHAISPVLASKARTIEARLRTRDHVAAAITGLANIGDVSPNLRDNLPPDVARDVEALKHRLHIATKTQSTRDTAVLDAISALLKVR